MFVSLVFTSLPPSIIFVAVSSFLCQTCRRCNSFTTMLRLWSRTSMKRCTCLRCHRISGKRCLSLRCSGRSTSGIHYVLSSLTSSHLKLLSLLARETSGTKGGLMFSTLYELCLCEMLVSSEKSLQLILKELEVGNWLSVNSRIMSW